MQLEEDVPMHEHVCVLLSLGLETRQLVSRVALLSITYVHLQKAADCSNTDTSSAGLRCGSAFQHSKSPSPEAFPKQRPGRALEFGLWALRFGHRYVPNPEAQRDIPEESTVLPITVLVAITISRRAIES